ncbi:NAD(P)/FAD-dependent oxidoreductase [Nocardia sp. CNY236]|uniref:FAD-dependent oxidoreductase n=1 Tax=Nocardia sp. CNY236 TaxID=1169152 RepID=UPI0003FFD6FA|nr:FAD-dependent monooxygenase [Nocardia sp. CNY236]
MQRDHAVVVGAGLAGLLTARILSHHFTDVVVVDRDRLPGQAQPRQGVAQSRHAHGLVARGQEIFETLFPGISGQLRQRGVVPGDFNSDIDWYFGGHLLAPGKSGLTSIPATRPTLEFEVRRRVTDLPNVVVRDHTEVTALRTRHRQVTGLELYSLPTKTSQEIETDFVVDCSGRGGRLAKWMATQDMTPPDEETVEIGLGYTSARFAVSEDPFGDKIATILANSPKEPRGCFFYRSPYGDNEVEISLTGMLGDHAPTDLPGFMEFVRSLPVPSIYTALRGAEVVDHPVKLTYPASRWRHYESCPELFDNLVPLGDAICSLDPIYAQGMTVAALQALELDRLLAAKRFSARTYHRACARIIGQAWSVSAGADLAYPAAKGRRTVFVRFANQYISALHVAARVDPVLSNTFFQVAGLMRSPATLFHPHVVARVLVGTLRAGRTRSLEPTRSNRVHT